VKRQIYTTVYDRKIDRLIGLAAFPVVNVTLAGIIFLLPAGASDWVSLLPWIVNGIILVLAFIFRPEMGIGYAASIAITLAGATALGLVFLVTCFTGAAAGMVLLPVGEGCASVLAVLLFFGLLLGSVRFLGRRAFGFTGAWWPSHEDRQWQIIAGFSVRTLKGHTDRVNAVAWSPQGDILASVSSDKTLRLWEMPDGRPAQTRTEHTGAVNCVAFSPDGTRLASGASDGSLRLRRARYGATLFALEGHTDSVNSVAFSPDATLLASAASDRTVRLWRVSDGACERTLSGHPAAVTCAAFSTNGALLAAGTDDEVWLWRVSDGTLLGALKGQHGAVTSVCCLPLRARLVSGSVDGTVQVWQWPNQQPQLRLTGHAGAVNSVAFVTTRLDWFLLASASNDGSVRLWHALSGAPLRTIQMNQGPVTSLAACPQTVMLATGATDGSLRLWKIL